MPRLRLRWSCGRCRWKRCGRCRCSSRDGDAGGGGAGDGDGGVEVEVQMELWEVQEEEVWEVQVFLKRRRCRRRR